MSKFKVGDIAYRFDPNYRVYRRDANGCAIGGPIYRWHFVQVTIVGEEGRSWLLDTYPKKISKAKAEVGLSTALEVDDKCFIADHRHRIADAVRTADIATLRKIAELIGYDEKAGA